MTNETDILQRAAEVLKRRDAAEAELRKIDGELSKVILEYSQAAKTWGYDRHKMKIMCEYKGFM